MPRSNAELYEEAERHLYGEAVRETEREIADDVFLDGESDQDLDYDRSHEDAEGWDGEPLGLDEIAHRNIEGDDENGFDRPLELRREQELESEVGRLREALSERDSTLDEVLNGPERQAAREAVINENLYQRYGVLATDPDKARAFINDLQGAHQSVEQSRHDRVNAHLELARERYGAEDFDRAFAQITSLDPNSRVAQAIVRDILDARDPGAAIMNFVSRSGPDLGALGLAGARTAPIRGGGGRRGRDIDNDDGGWGRRDVEQDIFDSAFD